MHSNTRLLPIQRERMVRDRLKGMSVKAIIERYGISRTTFYRWWKRFLCQESLHNRTSRPHRIRYRLTRDQTDKVMELRSKRLGPLRLALLVGVPATTVYRCLCRYGMGRLAKPARPPVVRYEAGAPGELIHLDVLHLFALRGRKAAYQFTAVDDYSRMAFALIAPQRTTQAALETLIRAREYFGFPIKRVLTDNDVTFAWTPRPRWKGPTGGHSRFSRTLQEWGIQHSLTRIGRPQTNGKVERFHRTIQEEMYRAHALFSSEEERRTELDTYLDFYNHRRSHTAINGLTPAQRRGVFFKKNQEVSPTS